ncbi:hypothetical protein CAPTEDRAFT_210269 [Capitella teleta]|uniref:Uncharacterized protein n=1 Tax=Capitella teleta TaxID=283909 RepID=N1PB31_CAPTE|nr:hypothetical protein CAPTEDRAFT_210269 [Capitella teleta]|eukprot:ELU18802.1 hypothetical protein CAPTEDRAFT_210269 [Capitella teleta]
MDEDQRKHLRWMIIITFDECHSDSTSGKYTQEEKDYDNNNNIYTDYRITNITPDREGDREKERDRYEAKTNEPSDQHTDTETLNPKDMTENNRKTISKIETSCATNQLHSPQRLTKCYKKLELWIYDSDQRPFLDKTIEMRISFVVCSSIGHDSLEAYNFIKADILFKNCESCIQLRPDVMLFSSSKPLRHTEGFLTVRATVTQYTVLNGLLCDIQSRHKEVYAIEARPRCKHAGDAQNMRMRGSKPRDVKSIIKVTHTEGIEQLQHSRCFGGGSIVNQARNVLNKSTEK